MRTDRRAEPEKGQATGISHLGVGHLRELAVARLKGTRTRNLTSVSDALSGQSSVVCT